jgi:hypothetical protein
MKDIVESRYNIPLSINALTRAFDSLLSRVQADLAHRMDDPEQGGKHIPSAKIVSSRSSTGFDKTQKKTPQSRKEKS